MRYDAVMADPHHEEPLDGLDRLTVRLYRTGLSASALGLCSLAAALVSGRTDVAAVAEWTVVAGVAVSVSCMHLYDKRIRWVIGSSAWVGALLLVAAGTRPDVWAWWVHHAGLGFVFVSLSAFALKEQFCFRIPLLRGVPAFLALSLVPMLAGAALPAAVLLGLAGLVTGRLAWAKSRMPLHFDIGDKSAYQV